MRTTEDFLLIALLLVVFVLGLFVIPRWRFKRAAIDLVRTFRQHGATRASNARTLDELGLHTQRSFLQTMLRGREYKGYALTALMKAQIIQQSEDGKLYLIEAKLPEAFRRP